MSIEPWWTNFSSRIVIEYKNVRSRKCLWKGRLKNVSNFVPPRHLRKHSLTGKSLVLPGHPLQQWIPCTVTLNRDENIYMYAQMAQININPSIWIAVEHHSIYLVWCTILQTMSELFKLNWWRIWSYKLLSASPLCTVYIAWTWPSCVPQWALLLTWINFNPSMKSNCIHYKIWDEITYPFLNFNASTVYWACNYLSMLGLKLIHVSRSGHRSLYTYRQVQCWIYR